MRAERDSRRDIGPDSGRTSALRLFAVVAGLVVLLGAVLVFVVGPALAAAVAPGLGLKPAAVVAFVVTLATMVTVAIAAGDGLLGEIQYMLGGFGGFFLIFWLMIAWIF